MTIRRGLVERERPSLAIPQIEPYEIPSRPEGDRVDWRLDPDRAVLLVHDMQEYFLRAYSPTAEPITTVVPAIAALCDASRAAGVPVVYSAQPGSQHRLQRGLLADFWGSGMAAGPDTEIIGPLRPRPDDVVLTKWRYSAFQRTELRQVLARAGRDQIIVTGVYAHMGCQVTAVEAFMEDVQPFLVRDAVADFSRAEHEQALAYVAKRCGCVADVTEVMKSLESVRQIT